VDLHFKEAIKDAPKMASELKNTVGVVDHGLFCGMATVGEWNNASLTYVHSE
jgi:ribose 5-phosphate isomerase A